MRGKNDDYLIKTHFKYIKFHRSTVILKKRRQKETNSNKPTLHNRAKNTLTLVSRPKTHARNINFRYD